MNRTPPDQTPTAPAAKEDRLRAALRANLQRRKAQARAREDALMTHRTSALAETQAPARAREDARGPDKERDWEPDGDNDT